MTEKKRDPVKVAVFYEDTVIYRHLKPGQIIYVHGARSVQLCRSPKKKVFDAKPEEKS